MRIPPEVTTILLSVLSALLTAGILACLKYISNLKKERKSIESDRMSSLMSGMKCMLRIEMIGYHKNYMNAGSIPSYAFRNWVEMHDSYKALGGNGMIDQMDKEIKALSIRENK